MFFNDQEEIVSSGSTQFMYKVYAWMSSALLVTAGTAYFAISSYSVASFLFRPGITLGLCLLSFALVIALQAMLRTISFITALGLFFLYAFVLGLMLSSIFMIYTQASIYATFLVTAGMFGAMALYGAFTKTDLTSMGSYAVMGLWGLILAMLVNMFLRSSQFDFLISCIGVVVFVLLTAVDSQKIKQLGAQLIGDSETVEKVALVCALTLYLDFLNLFLFLLRFMGQRRD